MPTTPTAEKLLVEVRAASSPVYDTALFTVTEASTLELVVLVVHMAAPTAPTPTAIDIAVIAPANSCDWVVMIENEAGATER
jgi:hypothetical protein